MFLLYLIQEHHCLPGIQIHAYKDIVSDERATSQPVQLVRSDGDDSFHRRLSVFYKGIPFYHSVESDKAVFIWGTMGHVFNKETSSDECGKELADFIAWKVFDLGPKDLGMRNKNLELWNKISSVETAAVL